MTYAELRQIAAKAWHKITGTGVAGLVILWNRNEPATQVAMYGETEEQRDVPRLLREVADKIEASKGKLVV